uniref:Zinc finger, CCHC-type n=1 Tax=Tanacetum cinerariifolium TaxID=118510 RepID=A0A6L2KF86_TANCI|nr:zinc finger, CCHC-type [Tanacetum cinerariifolium]
MAILEDEKEQKVSLHEENVGYKKTNKDSLWYLDNGASNHMTGIREHFKELDEKVSGKANLKIGTPVCLLANLKDDTWLWHARLGHLNFESLKSMAQRDLVRGIPTIKHITQICDVCLIEKHSRAPFPKKAKARSTLPLDLVYGDLCGPITPPTPSGKTYIFLLVDDYQDICGICVSRDVKFKENETWDWKDYMSEHINDEPEWTDFKIGNLKVSNEHHDQGFQPIEEDNEFPNNDDDYASPTRDSPTHSQTPHTPSTRSSEVNS